MEISSPLLSTCKHVFLPGKHLFLPCFSFSLQRKWPASPVPRLLAEASYSEDRALSAA